MEDRKLFKKRIQEFSKEYSERNGFILFQRTFLIRNRNDLLQMICFDFPPSGMQSHIAIQPLYIPGSDLYFTFGNKLNKFSTNEVGLWGKDKTTIEDDIFRISELLNSNVIPWFNEISTPQSLVDFIEHGDTHIIRCDPYFIAVYLSFSYLYLKKYDDAKIHLQKAIDLSLNRRGESNFTDLLISQVKLIDNKLYNAIENEVKSIIQQTKVKCKIEEVV